MGTVPLASIVISSYNYGRFLEQAIDSALGQTYPHTEVVVVDDGSTDNSREVIRRYGNQVKALLKENGGQASAFNAGIRASRGEVVFFVDSDDVLLPTAVERAMPLFAEGVVKVHWPLWILDGQGRKTGEVLPGDESLPEGDLREAVLLAGADGYAWPPTTGNGWSRRFLEAVSPLPEEEFRTCPDYYLATLAPLYGRVRHVPDPQGLYRIHGDNHGWLAPVEERLETLRQRTDHCLEALSRHCGTQGLTLDIGLCRANSWYNWLRQIDLATRELNAILPRHTSWILVDEGKWENRDIPPPGGRSLPFPEADGAYAGPPPDDETALREFERLRRSGASFMAFAWPAFWWLEYYEGLSRHLHSQFRCVLKNERLVVFDLRAGPS